MFIKENLNPKHLASDCVIRAIAKAEGKTWLDVYDALVVTGRKKFDAPTGKYSYDEYLKKYSTIDVMVETGHGKRRLTVNDVCDLGGSYIVSIAGHMTAVRDGVIYDTWNCGAKSAYKIWRVN